MLKVNINNQSADLIKNEDFDVENSRNSVKIQPRNFTQYISQIKSKICSHCYEDSSPDINPQFNLNEELTNSPKVEICVNPTELFIKRKPFRLGIT